MPDNSQLSAIQYYTQDVSPIGALLSFNLALAIVLSVFLASTITTPTPVHIYHETFYPIILALYDEYNSIGIRMQ